MVEYSSKLIYGTVTRKHRLSRPETIHHHTPPLSSDNIHSSHMLSLTSWSYHTSRTTRSPLTLCQTPYPPHDTVTRTRGGREGEGCEACTREDRKWVSEWERIEGSLWGMNEEVKEGGRRELMDVIRREDLWRMREKREMSGGEGREKRRELSEVWGRESEWWREKEVWQEWGIEGLCEG